MRYLKRLPLDQLKIDTRTWPIQTRSNCGRFEPLLKLSLNQSTVTQCDGFIFFCHATFFHERMLHLDFERAQFDKSLMRD